MSVKGSGGTDCIWLQDLFTCSWDTSCGNKFQFIDGSPDDNMFTFCPYCGCVLFEVIREEQE